MAADRHLQKSGSLTEPHKNLVRLLAQIAVEDFCEAEASSEDGQEEMVR